MKFSIIDFDRSHRHILREMEGIQAGYDPAIPSNHFKAHREGLKSCLTEGGNMMAINENLEFTQELREYRIGDPFAFSPLHHFEIPSLLFREFLRPFLIFIPIPDIERGSRDWIPVALKVFDINRIRDPGRTGEILEEI